MQLPETRRRFPRADLRVKARLSISGDPKRQFEATLPTADISVGGIFFESTFLLKIGMKLEVSLALPPSARPVKARGTVVRVETLQPNGRGRSGFAVKFSEYLDNSEVVLANFFLAPVLREFIQGYAKRHRFRADPEYLAHMADLLAAWELQKADGVGAPGFGQALGSSGIGGADRKTSSSASQLVDRPGRPITRAPAPTSWPRPGSAPPPNRPSAPRSGPRAGK